MVRLSAVVVAAAAVVAAVAVVVVAADSPPPLVASRVEAAWAASVRETRLLVLSKACGSQCMARIQSRLTTHCGTVRALPYLHMLIIRCGGEQATGSSESLEEMIAAEPDVQDTLPDSVVTVYAPPPAVGGADDNGGRVASLPTARQAGSRFWGLDRINQFALPLDGDESTAQCYPGAGGGVTVYVVDSGCSTGHPQFEGRATSEAAPGSRFRSGADDNGHGSHVAGTVGGRDTGVAKRVTIRCLKVLNSQGSGSSSDIVAAFDAVAGAKRRNPSAPIILSASLGGPAARGGQDVTTVAARRASQAGVVTVVAAGNDGGDACAVSPAQEPSVITVANANRRDSLAPSSNRGRCVDVIAPGTDILSVDGFSRGGGLRTFSGTSMAAPHVAGIAALILGDAGNAGRLTTADVQSRMTAGAPRVGGYSMAYAGGGACSGGPPPAPGPNPGPPTQPPTQPPEPEPETCTPRRWWVCRRNRRGRRRCRIVVVCAETGLPPASAPGRRRRRRRQATARITSPTAAGAAM